MPVATPHARTHARPLLESCVYEPSRRVNSRSSGFVTLDELRQVVRHKLKVKPSKLSENAIKALWCALDGDDSNQIQMDEFGTFLKGKRPSARELMPKPKRLPKKKKEATKEREPLSPEVLAALELRKAAKEAKPWRIKKPARDRSPDGLDGLPRPPLVPDISGPLPDKPSAVRRRLLRATSFADGRPLSPLRNSAACIALAQYNSKARPKARLRSLARLCIVSPRSRLTSIPVVSQYKQRMLDEMRHRLLATPIGEKQGSRLGGGRVLPLYESERLVARMEATLDAYSPQAMSWQWPVARAWAGPERPATRANVELRTTIVENMGRFDVRPSRPSSVTSPIRRTRANGQPSNEHPSAKHATTFLRPSSSLPEVKLF